MKWYRRACYLRHFLFYSHRRWALSLLSQPPTNFLPPFSSHFYDTFRFSVDEMTGRLTIIDAKRVDEGELKCVAENRAGKIQHAAYLKVTFWIFFNYEMKNDTFLLSGHVETSCCWVLERIWSCWPRSDFDLQSFWWSTARSNLLEGGFSNPIRSWCSALWRPRDCRRQSRRRVRSSQIDYSQLNALRWRSVRLHCSQRWWQLHEKRSRYRRICSNIRPDSNARSLVMGWSSCKLDLPCRVDSQCHCQLVPQWTQPRERLQHTCPQLQWREHSYCTFLIQRKYLSNCLIIW